MKHTGITDVELQNSGEARAGLRHRQIGGCQCQRRLLLSILLEFISRLPVTMPPVPPVRIPLFGSRSSASICVVCITVIQPEVPLTSSQRSSMPLAVGYSTS
jgi:hypothetical protein